MINRILIRIKVVQVLYSFMLTQSEFSIIPRPGDDASRDNKYAYDIYVATLLMILKLSGKSVKSMADAQMIPNKYLNDSGIARSLATNNDIRTLAMQYAGGASRFDPCLQQLLAAITSTGAYRSYIRTRNRDIGADVKFWTVVLRNIFATSPDFEAIARRDENFTKAGFTKGIKMAVDTLEGYADNRRLLGDARVALESSLDKAYDLYYALMWLPVELTRLQDERLDAARHKYLPTDEDLNPNLKFVNNRYIALIAESEIFEEYFKERPFKWTDDPILLRSLLDKVTASDIYRDYMADTAEPTLEGDAEFWRQIMRHVILPGDDIAEALENRSVYWNDDLDFMGTFALKTIRNIGREGVVDMLPKFKDEEDARFGNELFDSAISHCNEYRGYIDSFINEQQWDSERLALMDIVIMVAAITELIDYPAIPIAVTLNEYIEIANNYSTPGSGKFINGILYSVINMLKEQHKILKS